MEQFLLVGLGNPGPRYIGTRHNLGAEVLQRWQEKKDELRATNYKLHYLFPNTGMNNSGEAVAGFLSTHKIPVDHIIVLHDDVELPLGEVRVTVGGSAKGHNGVRSIQKTLGTSDFIRLRLGVGRPAEEVPLDEFVLSAFLPTEQEAVQAMIEKAQLELTARLDPK